VNRRGFLEYCVVCGGVLTLPGCNHRVAKVNLPSCTPPPPLPKKSADSMNVMEHPKDVIFAPPFLDERILVHCCSAVRAYSRSQGLTSATVSSALAGVTGRLTYLADLASSCRFAILGWRGALPRVLEQMRCIGREYPPESSEESFESRTEVGMDEPDHRVMLAAAIDLFAGAAFVSKDDPEQLRHFVRSLSRAIEDAIAWPLSFASDSAAYVGDSRAKAVPIDATIGVAASVQRLLDGSCHCRIPAPVRIRERVQALAHAWLRANPVSEFFEALSGPKMHECLTGISPRKAKVGDVITLVVPRHCLDFSEKREEPTKTLAGAAVPTKLAEAVPNNVVVMFCPHQPATIQGYSEGGLRVVVPPLAQSGPIALCRRPPIEELNEITCITQRFQSSYPAEWLLSTMTMIPLHHWSYPQAFQTSPWIEIYQAPINATVAVFDSSGHRAEQKLLIPGDEITVRYHLNPKGRDVKTPLRIETSGGNIGQTGQRNEFVFRPTVRGPGFVKLIWGSYSREISIHVA